MPSLEISESIVVNRPTCEVYEIVRDFKTWPEWSPWIIIEPDCDLSFSEDGKSYAWNGNIIGSGSMTLDQAVTGKLLKINLQFLKPWKSTALVTFHFDPIGGQSTKVTWSMNSTLPIFMFWMKGLMTGLIGMDYTRGLLMLKDFAETGDVPCRLEFESDSLFPGFDYLGIRTKCAIAEIGSSMEADLKTVADFVAKRGITPSGKPFSIYNKWNIARGVADYTICLPIDSAVEDLPQGMTKGHLPRCQTYRVQHTGPYRHLGNAWSAGMMHGRAKIFLQSRRALPFEIYESDPRDTPESSMITYVHLPSK